MLVQRCELPSTVAPIAATIAGNTLEGFAAWLAPVLGRDSNPRPNVVHVPAMPR